jgi:hypothetical protein
MINRARDDEQYLDDIRRVGRPRSPEEFGPPRPQPHERNEYFRRLEVLLVSLEIPSLGRDERLYLQRIMCRLDFLRSVDAKRFAETGEERVTLLLRTVFESSNGAPVLTLPILSAVGDYMNPVWTDRGLVWIETFDNIALVALQATLVELGLEDQFDRVAGGLWKFSVRLCC